MSATHTPGPWHAVSNGRYIEINIGESQYDPSIAECCPSKFSFNEDVEKANARLIAAAPELLEALEGIASATCEKWEMPYADFKEQFMPWARNVALAAIKKAKGETL